MSNLANRLFAGALILGLSVAPCAPCLSQTSTQLQGNVSKAHTPHTTTTKPKTQTAKAGTYFQRHPKVKSAAVGAGIGVVAGGATGLLTGRGMARGALIGGGTGAGIGVMRSSATMKKHPIVKDTLTGTAAGLGLGLAAGRRHSTAKATALGAAAGLGVGLLNTSINRT